MPVSSRLASHLSSWLGAWPPDGPGTLIVTSSPRRSEPGWDGTVRPVAGVATPEGAVLSVPERHVEAVRRLGDTLDTIGADLPDTVGKPGWRFFAGTFRWTEQPIPFDRPGIWLPRDHRDVLPWLKPFNGEVLVGYADGEIAAGVGRKIHDPWGHELAVVTENAHRNRGWAKRLVSQAAERVLEDGAIPIYLHSPFNEASARTADASGFPDRGWQILGIFPSDPGR